MRRRIEIVVIVILILWFIIASYLQHNIGLADNGDFSRSMGWITSGPVGIESNWPASGSADYSRRFFNYWIPFWELKFSIVRPTSSALLLWLPGAILNDFLYSNKVLYLPSLSLFSKLILFAVLLLLYNWIRLNTKYKTFLLVSVGVPITLMFITTDYVAYFNSFYQEAASLIYLLLLLVSVLVLKKQPSYKNLLCSLAFILLLSTAKQSNLYWPFLAIPLVFYAWSLNKIINSRNTIIIILTLILLFTFASAVITNFGSNQYTRYHSLFYGSLTFSNDPSARLRDIGMDDAAQCINNNAWTSVGSNCITKYQNKFTYQNTARVIYKEPLVMLKMLKYALDNMQDVSLDHLGKYSIDDPRSKTTPLQLDGGGKRYWSSTSEGISLDLWAELKFKIFPTGYFLGVVIIILLIWFIAGLKRAGIQQSLALVGLLTTVACFIDMIVAILGDGKADIIKHLFLSNVLFDIAAIVFFNGVLIYSVDHVGPNSLKSIPQKLSRLRNGIRRR